MKLYLNHILTQSEEANQDYFFQGACAGTVKTIMYYSGRFGICQPENVFVGQSVRVIIKYLSNNPEILHQPFAKLAVEALQKSWPCQSK